MLLVTVDTNLLDEAALAELRAATGPRTEFVTVSVNERERWDQPAKRLTVIPETLVWDESRWGQAVWAGPIPELLVLDETPLDSGVLAGESHEDILESVLAIISNGSFPKAGSRGALTASARRQLRDAMSFEGHVRARRHVFVTNDVKGFVNHGRREALERVGKTFIRTATELLELSRTGSLDSLTGHVSKGS